VDEAVAMIGLARHDAAPGDLDVRLRQLVDEFLPLESRALFRLASTNASGIKIRLEQVARRGPRATPTIP
jgi:hypothetical protein